MKKLPFLFTFFALALIVAAKNDRLPVIFDNHPLYDVINVEFADSATIVTMDVTANYESEEALTATPQLYVPQTQKDLKFKCGYIDNEEKTPISTNVQVKKGDKVVMLFDPHPSGIEEISYIEVKSWNYPRFITGIRLDNKPYHATPLPEAPDLRRDHLPAFEIAEADTAFWDLDMMSRLIHFIFWDEKNPCSEEKSGSKIEIDSLSRLKGTRFDIIPRSIRFLINGTRQTWLAVPGTKTRLALDSKGYAEAIENGSTNREALDKALKIYEAPLPEMYTTKRYDTSNWAEIKDSYRNLSFGEYAAIVKKEMNERKK